MESRALRQTASWSMRAMVLPLRFEKILHCNHCKSSRHKYCPAVDRLKLAKLRLTKPLHMTETRIVCVCRSD